MGEPRVIRDSQGRRPLVGEYAEVRGLIVDEIGGRCGQIPDLHPRLLEGIESAAALIVERKRPPAAEVRPPTCTGCSQPLREQQGLRTCDTIGCPGNLGPLLGGYGPAGGRR